MRFAFLALLALLVGCSGGGRPISSHAGWIFEASEFELFLLDPFEDQPATEKTTEKIGTSEAGTNLLSSEKVSGQRAERILELLRAAERRDFFTEPVELAEIAVIVMRFERDGDVYELSTDDDANFICIQRNGEVLASVVYKDPAPELIAALRTR